MLMDRDGGGGWIGVCKSTNWLKLMAESVDPLKNSTKSESTNCLPRETISEIYKATSVVGVAFDREI